MIELPTIKTSNSVNNEIHAEFSPGLTPVIVDQLELVYVTFATPAAAGTEKSFVILKKNTGCNVRFRCEDGQDIHYLTAQGMSQVTSEFEPHLIAGNLIEFVSIPTLVNNVRTNGVFLRSLAVE